MFRCLSTKALKVGFSGEGDHWLNQKVDSSKDTHLILNYLNLLKGAFGISIDPEDLWMDLALPDWPKNQERLKIHGKYIILHPGTTGYLPLRSWSPEGYAGIIGFLQHRGFHILITGQKAHQSMIEELLSFSKDVPKEKVTCLMDKSLDELIYYINGASAVVCSDTGVLHMAMALKVPVLGLFGPSNPAHTGPVGPGRYDVIRNDFQCGPCNYSSSYRMEDKKNCLDGKPPACMKSITAEQVITGLKNLLKI